MKQRPSLPVLFTQVDTQRGRLGRILGTGVLAALLLASAARAEVITSTDETFGVGALTLDTATQLEWLDLTLTQNKTVAEVQAGFGGYLAAGFRIATTAEAQQLFANAGVTTINVNGATNVAVDTPAQVSVANSLLSLLGTTASFSGGSMTGGFAMNPDGASVSQNTIEVFTGSGYCIGFGVATPCTRAISQGPASVNQRLSYAGVMLVKSPGIAVTIDPGAFTGLWDMDLANYGSGVRTFNLAPGTHRIRPGTGGSIRFVVNADGTVVPLDSRYTVSMTGGLRRLTFKTRALRIDPGEYLGIWRVSRVRDELSGWAILSGPSTLQLVPNDHPEGLVYVISAGISSSSFQVGLRGDGSLSITNAQAAYSDAGTLRLANAKISVDDSGVSPTPWSIREVASTSGDRVVVHVPGLQYLMQANGVGQFYTVDHPCSVAPSSLVHGGSTFELGCAPETAPGFRGIGSLSSDTVSSKAYGVSSDGSVVVGLSGSSLGGQAFRWTATEGMTGLGILPGAFQTEARASSPNGAVIVGTVFSGSTRQAFRWDSGSGMVGLGQLPGGTLSEGSGVSSDGSVVVGFANGSPVFGGQDGFRWTSGTGMVPFELGGAAFGISPDGSIAVGGSHFSSAHAWLWRAATGLRDLGDLPGGSPQGLARALSANGSVVVGHAGSAAGEEAFVWTESGGMIGLGDLDGGSFFSRGHGVSGDGAVVVGLGKSVSGDEAILWTAHDGLRSLKLALENEQRLALSGCTLAACGTWQLTSANGISADGRTIVGEGRNPRGEVEGWIATLGTGGDADGDGFADGDDNCPDIANPDQADLDADGQGDACDADRDGDGVLDASDNCAEIANADQADNDVDELGDVCDPDDDNDGVTDDGDNCPFTANADQVNQDSDLEGDACDTDRDGDGLANAADNCPEVPNADQADLDSDLAGDVCDLDDDGDGVADDSDNCALTANTDQLDLDRDGIGDACDADEDGDGVEDGADNCEVVANPDQADANGDGQGDACDVDDDGDGHDDAQDNCPLVANPDQANFDGDIHGDACDVDDDNDGVSDGEDNCPLLANSDQGDADGDLSGDACDADDDNDGVSDASDNCPLVANPSQANVDGDALGDACDGDLDGDAVPNASDNCELYPNSDQQDLDADGIGDPCDVDLDGDAVPNGQDNCPVLENPGQADLEGDGLGDVCDADDDGDGVPDAADNCPVLENPGQADFDADGSGDACDTDDDSDGVSDSGDLCPATPLGTAVEPQTGCSLTQLVPCSGPRGSSEPWRNHGQYQSAIARTTQSLMSLGLITPAERDVLISGAASSNCGTR